MPSMDSFLCWKLKVATLALAFFVIIAASLACILELLDIISLGYPRFQVAGGFQSSWRAHVWEGWLACNIVMLGAHLVMIACSGILIIAVKRLPTYFEQQITRWYAVIMACYVIVELGTVCYKYSWYGPNTFRLGYLIFCFLYWLVRACVNTIGVIVLHSRAEEINYEMTYGVKKNVGSYASQISMLDRSMRSGLATPSRSGYATPSRSGVTTPRPANIPPPGPGVSHA